MGVILGARTTKNIQDVKDRDFESKIVLLQPDQTPFMTFLMSLPSKVTEEVKFEHAQDDFLGLTATIAHGGGYISTDTVFQLVAGDASKVPNGAQLFNKTTGEMYRVTAVDTSLDTVTVSRAEGSVAATTVADAEVLIIASEATEENAKFIQAVSTNIITDFNYTQQFETAIQSSWRQQGTKDLTQPDWQFQVYKASIEHKRKMEAAFMFGTRNLLASGPNGQRVSYTDGLYQYILRNAPAANMKTLTGPIKEKDLEDWLEPVLRFGNPNRKSIITSPFGKLLLGRLGKGYVETERSDKTLGLTISKIEINGHLIPVLESLLLSTVFNDLFLLIDTDNVRKRTLTANGKSFATKWYKDVQDNDQKGQKDVLFCDEGLMVTNQSAHGFMKGATA